MKELIRIDKVYRLHELPELKSNAFSWHGEIGYTGSLIKRPVKALLGIYKHFAFIYGFDLDETLWIIENNVNGVECITFRDFQAGCEHFIIEHNRFPNSSELIMLRAHERASLSYSERNNNCEHFVNYCLYEDHESIQVKITEDIANVLISVLEIRIHLSPSLQDHKLLDGLNDLRKSLQIERHPDLQNLFNERRKHLEALNNKTNNLLEN